MTPNKSFVRFAIGFLAIIITSIAVIIVANAFGG